MNLRGVIFLCVFALCYAKDCSNVNRTNSKLVCYYSKLTDVDNCYCTHIILPANTDVKLVENFKQKITGAKILLTVNEFNEGLVNTVKQNHIDGLELNLKKLSTKDDIAEFISTVRTKLGNDLFLALSIPPNTELLAKYYDLKALAKTTDLYILQTSFLGASKNVTFHPSRLSGLWDMQNTDSVVDLVSGLGAPLSRVVVAAPVQAFQFTLQDDSLTTPGSPALQLKSITRKELCERMKNKDGGSWTLERDQDQAGPYIFRGKEWIAFEDSTSMDIKAKYTRVRGLAGLALKDLTQDITKPILDSNENEEIICDSLLTAAHVGLSRQTRAPRQAVLRSLEREILETPAGHLSTVNVSPYRITRIVDVEGHVHSVRKDTRTEFECSRQGYFVHPHSCGRFYRCVKFDQLIDEFSVFEFDCPAGLVFDERVEVCVWPGNLPDGAPCHGSSEIAPVPKNRFNCPGKQGYFADPENCRWFFACLDHGKSGLTAYEFRCPFGLVFDEERLLCEWPWLVPTCGSGYISGLELDNIEFYGGAAKSTIIPGNGGNKIVNVQLQPQVNVVSSGAHLLDTYDGLGSLGAVSLGGYSGDLNLLKQNINIHSGYNNLGSLAHVSDQNIYQAGLEVGNVGSFGSLNSGYQSSGFGEKLTGASVVSSIEDQSSNGAAYLRTDAAQFNGFAGNTVLVDNGAKSNEHLSLLANAGLSAGSLLQYDSDLNKANLAGHYQTVQHSIPLKVTEVSAQPVVELQGQKYSGSLDYNYQYANEAKYNIQPVVTQTSHVANVGVVDKHNNDAVFLNNANLKYNTASSISYANKLSHNIADQSTHGESVLTALPVEKTVINLAVTPKPDFLSLIDQQKSVGFSSVHHVQQPLVTEVKTPVIQQTVVPLETHKTHSGSSYSSFNQYHTPSIQYEQNVQPIVSEYKTQNVQQLLPAAEVKQQSYSSYNYQTPVVHHVQKVQPLVEVKTPIVKQNTYSSTHYYQTPTIQYEQKVQPIVAEYKTPVVQETVVPISKAQQTGYSSSYHYQAPAVHYEQKVQPIVTEIKTPVVQQTVVPVSEFKQSGYSSSYHYQAPAIQYEQKVQPIVTEIKTPVVQETVVPVSNVKQTGYSSSYHYQAPAVQYEQKVQPVEIKSPIVYQQTSLPVKQTSYHYQAPAVQYEEKVQPIVTEIKTPVVQQEVKQSYSSSYQYQTPVVHYEQKVQPLVTEIKTQPLKQTTYSSSYHYQAPEIKYEKVQPLVEIKTQPQEVKQSYSSSYQYQTPVVQYEQKQQPLVHIEKQTVVPLQQVKHSSYSSGYQYQAPVQEYKQVVQPVVTEYKTPIIQKEIVTEAKQTGYSSSYHYQAPSVEYKEVQPVITEVKAPLVQQQTYHYQQPAVKLQQIEVKTPIVKYEQKIQPVEQKETYYQFPQVQYEQKQEAKSHSQFYGVQHNIQLQQQPQIVETVSVTPKFETVSVTPQYVNHQYYDKRVHEVKLPVVHQPSGFVSVTPKYESQSVQPISYEGRLPVVEEKIVPVKAYQTYTGHSQTKHVQQIKTVTEAPVVVNTYLPSKPVVNTYYISTPKPQIYKAPEVYVSTTPKYSVFQEFIQPKQTFEIRKKVVPVTPTYETYSIPQKIETYAQSQPIVETYNYNHQPTVSQIKQDIVFTTAKPKAYLPPKAPQVYVSSTPKYQETIEIKKPASPTVISQYEYVNPEYANYESKLNLNFDHFNTQPTNTPVEQYHTQTAFYSTQEQQPLQVVPVEKYQTDFVVSTPKPTFISTIAPVLKQTPTVRTKIVAIDKYKTYDDQYLVSTPKQFYVSTPAPVIKTEDSLPPFRYYDSRLDTAVKKTEYYNQYDDYIASTETPKIVSTVQPIIQRKKIASTTTPIPLNIYDDYADVNYGSQYLVEVKPSTYKPKIKQYLVSSTTDTPLNFYYEDKVKSTVRPVTRKKIVSTTTEAYEESTYKSTTTSRPIVKKKKIIVTTSTSPAPIDVAYDYDEYIVSSEGPKYESVKITPRPKAKGKTVVRVNDFHPFLTTKLGAQCTCVSNTVKLRKGNRQKEVEEFDYELPENVPVTKLTKSGPSNFDDYNEPGVYVVGNSDIDDDYSYELKKVTVTKTPEVVVKSTTNAIQPAPTPEYSHRRRITTARPTVEVTSVSNNNYASRASTTRVEEVFLLSTETPAINKRLRTKSKEQKIVEAVNEGLSLVKSTVKSAVKEAIAEENRNFDRYGPGGWRSRGETLQGSVDCKREGLFRHPTQCNKFYACRWDCTKQRYTLHIFNCPVHLTFDTSQGACNWPSKGPACTGNTLLPSS